MSTSEDFLRYRLRRKWIVQPHDYCCSTIYEHLKFLLVHKKKENHSINNNLYNSVYQL